MKSAERIKLTKGEWFNHFGISIYFLIPILIFGYLFVKLYLLKMPNSKPDDFNFFYLIMLFIGASIFLYWQNWKRLFFQEYKFEMTEKQFQRVIKVTAKELDWQITKFEKNHAEAFRFPEPFEDGGEKITIKKTENKVLINSMGNPELSKKGYSRKRNKENLNSFLINVENVLRGKDVEKIVTKKLIQKEKDLWETEEGFWEEREWTFGNILMRIVGYGLTMVFLLIGLLLIYEGVWGAIFSIILSIGIGFFYIKNDIQIIREKNRRRKLKKN
jgi:hypothetical protein